MVSLHSLETEQEQQSPVKEPAAPGSDPTVDQTMETALNRQREHEYRLEQVQNILRTALNSKHAIDWDTFKRHDAYSAPEPAFSPYVEYPPEPQISDSRYQPASGEGGPSLDSRFEQKKRDAFERFVRDYSVWAEEVKKIEADNQKRYTESFAAVRQWNDECRRHRLDQAERNRAIEKRQADYVSLRVEAVEDYCRQVLWGSELPDKFPRVFDLQYLAAARTLIIEHSLPVPQDLPRIKGVKFLKASGEYVDVSLSDTQFNRVYASVLHQICLRTIYELFDADVAQGLNTVVFNGWVETPDPVSGARTRVFIISVRVEEEQFKTLNLWDTEAKACFKALKATAKAKLHTLTPVTPVLTINRQAARAGQANAAGVSATL